MGSQRVIHDLATEYALTPRTSSRRAVAFIFLWIRTSQSILSCACKLSLSPPHRSYPMETIIAVTIAKLYWTLIMFKGIYRMGEPGGLPSMGSHRV